MGYDGIGDQEETAVISDEMIAEAFEEEGLGEDEYGNPISGARNGLKDVILADEIAVSTSLKLSFKNVLKIDNLQGFAMLRRLCLDNNIIQSITNLSHLVHLEWLDLSFNNITKISGLDKLTKLKDLSLFSNRITEVEGLDSCTALQCLSLGNNLISSLESVVTLRKFRGLQLLNLEGNPVSEEAEYRTYVLAYMRDLKYLDYAMVLQTEVASAQEQYQDELLDVEEKEALEEEKTSRETTASAHTKKLKEANLSVVETLFRDMFEDDEDYTKLKALPGVPDLTNKFGTELESASDAFEAAGLEKDKEKRRERNQFSQSLQTLRSRAASESVKLIEAWSRKKKHALRDLAVDKLDPEEIRRLIAEVQALGGSLMDIEMRLVEQSEELLNDFEARYREIHAACLEVQITFFRQTEDCENIFAKELTSLANDLLDKAANEDLPEDISDEASNLLIDRDTCMTAITGSHDVHVGKLYKNEEVSKFSEVQHLNETLRGFKDEEHNRNRERVLEIHRFVAHNKGELELALAESAAADEFEFA